jgi:hypothetical protein
MVGKPLEIAFLEALSRTAEHPAVWFASLPTLYFLAYWSWRLLRPVLAWLVFLLAMIW